MGVAFHELKFLQLAAKSQPLGKVLTFGRQSLNVPNAVLVREFGENFVIEDSRFADEVLRYYLHADSVSSVDHSDYEGATLVGDLNKPLDLGTFDTVIDFGTSEHIFDVASALRNAIAACKTGGRIIHSLPSNSECGHGFYQFSPELFFSLYSEKNGFSDTLVYIADVMDERHWYAVSPPSDGKRVMVNSALATYVLCCTTKERETATLNVQQSDYIEAWKASESTVGAHTSSRLDMLRDAFKGSKVASLGYRMWLAKTGLTRFNTHLRKVRI